MLSPSAVEELFQIPEFIPDSVDHLRAWLQDKRVDLSPWDAAKQDFKSLQSLYDKSAVAREARLVFDPKTQQVFRLAEVVKIAAYGQFGGELYPYFELLQIFFDGDFSASDFKLDRFPDLAEFLARASIRGARVRSTEFLWETIKSDESPWIGAMRGLEEELKVPAENVHFEPEGPTLSEYEKPLDWPGIHSGLRTTLFSAILPPELSKPCVCELEKDQLTIFVCGPAEPLGWRLLASLIPQISCKL